MGIKIRVRVAGEDGTQKLEVPEVCTLAQLRKAVATKCMGDVCAPSAVAVTLNRTDDVGAHGAVNESATLRACGIARGDLIYVFQVGLMMRVDRLCTQNSLSAHHHALGFSREETFFSFFLFALLHCSSLFPFLAAPPPELTR